MPEVRLNCWEFQGCGAQPDRSGDPSSSPCPSVVATKLDGANGGVNGGRSCWVISGTLCDGAPAGDHAEKISTCRKCAFMHRVAVEEGLDFLDDETLISMHRNGDSD